MELYRTKYFIVSTVEHPHISREEGGHIVIAPITPIVDRTHLSPEQAIECMRLTCIVGEAMTSGLARQGIFLGRINYQDNGNWGIGTPEGPHFHIQLYGRAVGATIQKFGEAPTFPRPSTGFYDTFKPLTEGDCEEIRKDIDSLVLQEKYKDQAWGL